MVVCYVKTHLINDLYHKKENLDVTTYFVGKINEYTLFLILRILGILITSTDRVVDPFNLPDLLSDQEI